MTAGCASAPVGAEPEPDPTAALPLPGPEDPADEGARPAPGATAPALDGPLATRVVVIDPGHNGGNAEAPEAINRLVPAGHGRKACDTVGSQTAGGYAEHEFNLDFSLLLRDLLEADGATVVLTREDNEGVGPCIDERARIGNDAEADAAISIHADGGPPGGRGFHVIAPGEVDGHTEAIVDESMLLAQDILREYGEGSGMPHADYLAEEGLDVRTDLGGLNLSTVPKVFLEAGNMRNTTDAVMLEDPEWRATAAEAVARGLAHYLMRN